jgi:LuxR family transcriptional regulator/LuxR family quorum-sensing system transcriptional regulator CciR
MQSTILRAIAAAQDREALFGIFADFFNEQGAGGVVYVAQHGPASPYVLMERGFPQEWLRHYEEQRFADVDPIPGILFRLGHPKRLDDLLADLPSLSHDERRFIEAFETQSGISNGMLIPTFGPLGRPGFIGLTDFDPVGCLDRLDLPLANAVAQAFHIRMELLQVEEPPPNLSPREREILSWLIKGKSTGEIATIVGSAEPTVATHVKRIYGKLRVNDRATCIAKALAYRYV